MYPWIKLKVRKKEINVGQGRNSTTYAPRQLRLVYYKGLIFYFVFSNQTVQAQYVYVKAKAIKFQIKMTIRQ